MNEGQMLADLAKLNKLAAKRNINKTHLYGRFFEKHRDYFLASIYSQPTDNRVLELDWKPSEEELIEYASQEELFLFAGKDDYLAIANGVLELVQIKIKQAHQAMKEGKNE